MLPFLALNEHFTGGKVNNYLVQEIFIGGVFFIMYYKFCLTLKKAPQSMLTTTLNPKQLKQEKYLKLKTIQNLIYT
jgi:hypothetical protein